MSASSHVRERRHLFGDMTAPGRSSFDWAVFFAAVALLIPVSGVVGIVFAERSRRKGYPRWKAAMAIAIWCAVLGVIVRGMLRIGVFP